ncbi:MAG: FG-GAP-like repeat-containing protein [Desulfobacteraceae bacterium]|jgi:RHS repeat-associated protein
MRVPNIKKYTGYNVKNMIVGTIFTSGVNTGRFNKKIILSLISLAFVIFVFNCYAEDDEDIHSEHITMSIPSSGAQMGEASTSVPIVVPPGRNGVQPNLHLNYSSLNNKSGVAGVGWNLDIGFIQRNTRFGLNYSNDGDNAFIVSMEGSSGELIQRTDWGTDYYGLEIESSFYKFHYLGATSGWVVTSTDGTKYYFGQASHSRQYDPSNSNRVYKWCLDKVLDTNGNYMKIDYSNISNNSYGDNEIYLKKIRYTANNNFSESFPYSVKYYLEDKEEKLIPYYNPGYEVITSKRLKTIEILYENTLVRAYTFTYEESTDSGKTLLSTVQQYGSNASVDQSTGAVSSGDALPELVFDYYNNPVSAFTFSEDGSMEDMVNLYTADFNGDGLTDILGYSNASCSIELKACIGTLSASISNGDGTFSSHNIMTEVIPHPTLTLGDFNGNGKTDLFYRTSPVPAVWKVYFSNGDGTFSNNSNQIELEDHHTSVIPLDFNGDGKTDFISVDLFLDAQGFPRDGYSPEYRLFRSNGNGSFTNCGLLSFGPSFNYVGITPFDFNGDGKSDLAIRQIEYSGAADNEASGYYAFISDGTGSFTNASGTSAATINTGNYKNVMGDFNGDGLMDILAEVPLDENYPDVYEYIVYFSKGDGTFDQVLCNDIFDHTTNEDAGRHIPIHTGDFNGDGLTDIMAVLGFRTTGHAYLNYYISKGDGTFEEPSNTTAPWNVVYNRDTGYPISPGFFREIAGDFNGDGKSDLLWHDGSDAYWHIGSHSNDFFNDDATDIVDTLPDQLTVVQNGKGGTTTFEYLPSTQYDKDQDDVMPFIMQMVSSLSVKDGTLKADGTEISYTTSYNYYGADYDRENKDFLGFKDIEKTNPDDTFETTQYHQDHYKKNRPFKTKFYEYMDEDEYGYRTYGSLLSEIDYIWDTYPTDPNVWAFIKLIQKKTTYEGNASYFTQENYTYYNNNGFPETIAKSGIDADGNAIEQITQYKHYGEYGTDIWRVDLETVTGAATGITRKMTYDYDSKGNVISKIFWRTELLPYNSITYINDDYGNVTSVIDARENETIIDYDLATETYPSSIINAENHEILKTWDYRFGREDQVRDENENWTDYEYDAFGRIDNISFPDGGYSYVEYDDTSFPRYTHTKILETGSIETGDYVEKIEYFDGIDRTIKTVTYGINNNSITPVITDVIYDNMGRKDIVYGPYFEGTSIESVNYQDMEYDKLGRIVSTATPDGEYGTVSIVYNYPNPFTTIVTDADNRQKTEKRDHLGRIIEVIEHADAGPQSTRYEYNASNDMTKVINALLYETIFNYDLRGLKENMDDPDMGYWFYTYDEHGNLETQTDSKGQVTMLTYDNANRVITKTYTPVSADNPPVTYTYDDDDPSAQCINCIGKLYAVTNTKVTTKFDKYDEMGRIRSVTKAIDGDQERTVETEYYKSGKVKKLIYLDDMFEVVNTYYPKTDLLNTVIGKESSGNEVEYAKCTQYQPNGKIGRIYHDYNHTETQYAYDNLSMRLMDIKTYSGATVTTFGTEPIQDKSYTYTPAGDIEEITDYQNESTYTYTYDNLHRLMTETGGDSSPPTSTEILIYNYDYPDHINAVSSINYNGILYNFTYDANGNMLTGPDFSDPSNVAQRTIEWDAENMPTKITQSEKGTTYITYDGNGKRAKKTEDGVSTYYMDSTYEIKDGNPIKYIFAGNLRVAKIEGANIHIFHKDHLNSSTVITDDSGTTDETSEYFPFGSVRKHSGQDISDYKYTDQEDDTSTGLYNYNARLYDPSIGRFASADTVVPNWYAPQSLNRYSYCLNNPLIYADPSGHFVTITTYVVTINGKKYCWIYIEITLEIYSYDPETKKKLDNYIPIIEDAVKKHIRGTFTRQQNASEWNFNVAAEAKVRKMGEKRDKTYHHMEISNLPTTLKGGEGQGEVKHSPGTELTIWKDGVNVAETIAHELLHNMCGELHPGAADPYHDTNDKTSIMHPTEWGGEMKIEHMDALKRGRIDTNTSRVYQEEIYDSSGKIKQIVEDALKKNK